MSVGNQYGAGIASSVSDRQNTILGQGEVALYLAPAM